MRIVKALAGLPVKESPRVLALGMFDGVHVGHRRIISAAVQRAKAMGASSLVLTLDPHPAEVLSPGTGVPYLTTLEERAQLVAGLGIDILVVLEFTPRLAATEARTFVEEILVKRMKADVVFVGYNYTFGRGARGNAAMLEKLGRTHGFETVVVEPVQVNGTVVSSTVVRELIQKGEVEAAARFLGYPPVLIGRVVEGDGRGAVLGFPTANLAVEARKVVPGRGVYVICASWHSERLGGLANIGVRPTFGGSRRGIEVHLFDFARAIYGQVLKVEFLKRLRDEMSFAAVPDLVEQIRRDVADARMVLGEHLQGHGFVVE